MDPLQSLLSSGLGIAEGYVAGGISVSVKTNYGPEIPIYSGAMSGGASTGAGGTPSSPSLLSTLLGLKAAVIVRDATGRTLTTFGTPPATDPVRVGVALGIVALVALIMFRGVLK